MDRLTTLDAEFLHLEDVVAHMHIAGACTFANPPPPIGEVIEVIEAKLDQVPRYRQRVRSVPYELGRPVWIDDPHFDVTYHVRHVAVPAPHDDASFGRLMGQLMSQPLDRNRPLWELTVVEGLHDDRWALVFKVHHCMVDGVAGVGLLTVLLDLSADEPLPTPKPWQPAAEPDGTAMVLDAWSGLADDTRDVMKGVGTAALHPIETAKSAGEMAGGFLRFAGSLRSNPEVSIEGTIGPHRSWAWSTAELSAVRDIRSVFGGTVNDVVLSAVAGGHRELLLSRGEDPDEAVIRTVVPVSTRHEDGDGVTDNRVSTLFYELPVHIDDPVVRLDTVQVEMNELKASHEAEFGDAMIHLGDLAPPMVVGPASRLAIRVLQDLPQRSINTITTNVPGPQFPLFSAGREMLEYLPFVPITHGIRVATAILSYNGHLTFGVTGDLRDAAPDVGVLADAVVDVVAELRRRACDEGPYRPRTADTTMNP